MMSSHSRWCRHIPDYVVRYQMMPSDTRWCRHIPDDVVTYQMMSLDIRWCRQIPEDAVTYQMMSSYTTWCRHIPDDVVTYQMMPSDIRWCCQIPDDFVTLQMPRNSVFMRAVIINHLLCFSVFRRVHKNCKRRRLDTSCLSVSMSVCLSVRPSVQLCYRHTDFHEIWYWSIFFQKSIKFQVSSKYNKTDGHVSWKPTYIFDHISLHSS